MITDFLVGTVFVAIVYTLVRPGSPAADAVHTISNALIAVVGTVTGAQTTAANPGTGTAPLWPPAPPTTPTWPPTAP